MSNEWEREKQKILNALIGQGQDLLDFPQETEVCGRAAIACSVRSC